MTPATGRHDSAFVLDDVIRAIREQLRVHAEYITQRALDLLWRVVVSAERTYRRFDQLAQRRNVLSAGDDGFQLGFQSAASMIDHR